MQRKNNANFASGQHVTLPDGSNARVLKIHGKNYVEVRIMDGPNLKPEGGRTGAQERQEGDD